MSNVNKDANEEDLKNLFGSIGIIKVSMVEGERGVFFEIPIRDFF